MREKRVLEGEGFLVSVRRVMQKSIVLWLHNTNRMTDLKMSQMTGQLTSDDSGNGAEASACHSQSRRR